MEAAERQGEPGKAMEGGTMQRRIWDIEKDKRTGTFIQNSVSTSEATGRFQEGLIFSSCHLLWPVGFALCPANRAHGHQARDLLRQVARAPGRPVDC
ncbi:hypothetical protein CapIbe_011042 [Capra ibex]